MLKRVVVDVPEFNRYIVTVEGRDIEEIKRNAREAVYRQESDRKEVAVKGIDSIEPFVHPIKEEDFFYDPEKKETRDELPLGITERYSFPVCDDCTVHDLNAEEAPEGHDFVYEEFKCGSCRSWIAY